MEAPLYDETYERLLEETDPQERETDDRDGWATTSTTPTAPSPSSTSAPRWWQTRRKWLSTSFGSLTGVFGHLEYAKRAQ